MPAGLCLPTGIGIIGSTDVYTDLQDTTCEGLSSSSSQVRTSFGAALDAAHGLDGVLCAWGKSRGLNGLQVDR